MKIQVLSDLHLEHCRSITGVPFEEKFPPPCADVVVFAGDIDLSWQGMMPYVGESIPMVYVAGNHEFYRGHLELVNTDIARCARFHGVHYLDARAIVIDGVRFLGVPLWTDFALYPGREEHSMRIAGERLNDFSLIKTWDGPFTPEHSVSLHMTARRWLGEQLSLHFDGPTVVVTHHAPSAGSIHPRFLGDPLTPAFVSELSELAGLATVWIHGHCHDSFDYDWQGTRVVANPRGYPLSRGSPLRFENPNFDPRFVVEV